MRPSISTKTGDKGTTGLYGGKRVPKSAVRLHAYGDIDELNSILGVVLAEKEIPTVIRNQLDSIQNVLFEVGSDLATPLDSTGTVHRISESMIKELELLGHSLESQLPQLTHFILPSGSRTGSLLHQARTVCRRAERWIVSLGEQEEINTHVSVYINRLSDYLFLAARFVNLELGEAETIWESRQRV